MMFTNVFQNGIEICNRHDSNIAEMALTVNRIMDSCRIANVITLPNQVITIFTQTMGDGVTNDFVVIRCKG